MVLKAIFVCIICLICISIIKEYGHGIALMLSVAGIITLFWIIVPYIEQIINKSKDYINYMNIDSSIFLPLIKVVIIALTTRLTAEICRDRGERALGYKIEMVGIIAGIICSFPLLDKALTIIGVM